MDNEEKKSIESEEVKEIKSNLWDITDSKGQIEPLPEDGKVYENDINVD